MVALGPVEPGGGVGVVDVKGCLLPASKDRVYREEEYVVVLGYT